MQNLIAILNTIKPLSEQVSSHLISKLKKMQTRKKQMLLSEGNISKRVYFIEKGILRAYFLVNGKEHTTWFFKENDIIFSIDSFISQVPSNEYIETLEECVLWSISYDELNYIYNTFIEFNYHGRYLTEKYYCLSEQRNFVLRMKTIKDKYNFLLQQIPNILSRVSLKTIASHLEVEPETLSRIRAKKK